MCVKITKNEDQLNEALLCVEHALFSKLGYLTEEELKIINNIKEICDQLQEIDEGEREDDNTI